MAQFLNKIFTNNLTIRIMKNSFSPLLIIICFLFLLVFSCKKDKPPVKTCDVLNPVTELQWLKDTIQGLEQLGSDKTKYYLISSAVYQGETVFIQTNCDPLGNSVFPVFNCTGEQVSVMGEINPESISDRSIIWVPANSACNAND
jgi:hypothetical protein